MMPIAVSVIRFALAAISVPVGHAADGEPRLAVMGEAPHNAFRAAAEELGITLEAADAPDAARFEALLICAPDYPQVAPMTEGARASMERFLAAGKAVYVEYTPLAGLVGEAPQVAGFERLYVATDGPALGLPPLAILEEHQSLHLPLIAGAAPGRVLLRYGRVAGLDRAVFGPPQESSPALFELVRGNGRLLVATTALSNAVRGRYGPTREWATLLREVLLALLPAERAGAVRDGFIEVEAWTEPREWVPSGEVARVWLRAAPGDKVTATGPAGEIALEAAEDGVWVSPGLRLEDGEHALRVAVTRGAARREATVHLAVSPRQERYREAVARNLRWFEEAGMLPADDGTLGVREGLTSRIGPDGRPQVASGLRVDCVSECALLFYLYGRLMGDDEWLARGERMLGYVSRAFGVTSRDCWYFGHWQSRGEFREDGRTVYVFNDDSGAATLFSLLGYAATGDEEQLRAGLRGVEYFCSVASETTGLFGHMPHRDYEGSGRMGVPWPVLRGQEIARAAPHVMNLPQAALLVAYQLTGEERYLEVARRGIRTLMTRYPDWHIVTSRTCEHGRMLLPLALLNRADPSREHREWLDTVVDFLVSRQDPCGAIAEWDGHNPTSNDSFGTAETSVFQENGDAITDQLYGTGFALLHLGLAYQVTGDERIREAYERLGDYLTRIQMRDPEPRYEGTWLRAFDFGRWEYFGSSADIGWGPYCSETGWMCAPIGLGLLLHLSPAARDAPGAGVLSLPDRPDVALQALVARARSEAEAVEAALSAAPTAVAGLQAGASRGPYAELAWDAPQERPLTYRVHRAREADFAPGAGNLVGSVQEGHWTDRGLEADAEYFYRVVAVNGLGEAGPLSGVVRARTGAVSRARGRPYVKSLPPHPSYTDVGDRASTDGFYAGGYRDRRSYGYRLAEVGASVTVVVTVDLGEAQGIARASHHNCGAPGYRPDRMTVAVSADGEAWAEVGSTEMVSGGLMIVDFAETQARFVRFEFSKRRSGSTDDWLFLDEMEVF